MKHFVFLAITFVLMCRSFAQQSDTALLILSDSKLVSDSTVNNGSTLRTSPALHSLSHSKQTSKVALPSDPIVLPKKGTIIIEHKKNGINNQ